jgi:predicted transcriptional regulator
MRAEGHDAGTGNEYGNRRGTRHGAGQNEGHNEGHPRGHDGTPGGERAAERADRRGAQPRRASGEREAEVLAVLQGAGRALTPGEVAEQLSGDPAYTTVVTVLSRMHDKGLLTRRKRGRAFAYTPVADSHGLTARRMRQELDADTDRQAVLSRFVSDLSDEDERLLRGLLGDLPEER